MASSPRSLSRIGATRICRHFIALILLAQIWAVTQPRASGQLEVIVGKGGEFLAGYIGGKLLDSQVDSWRGIPDVRDLKLKIDELVQVDYEHRGLLRELSYKLDERMTREQVKTLLTESLSRIDERLLKLALRIDKQQRELDQFAKDLGLTRVELTAVNQQVLKHESRLQDQDQKIAEIRVTTRGGIVRSRPPRSRPRGSLPSGGGSSRGAQSVSLRSGIRSRRARTHLRTRIRPFFGR